MAAFVHTNCCSACRAALDGGTERFVYSNTAGIHGAVTPRLLRNYHTFLDIYEELS